MLHVPRPKLENPFARITRPNLIYGFWRDPEGRIILFDRKYRPLLQRKPADRVRMADPQERVSFDHEAWFYDDSTPLDIRRALAELTVIRLIEAGAPFPVVDRVRA
jgi:hypothetical protein